MKASLAKKQQEAEVLKAKLQQTRLVAQQLRLRLRAAGVSDPSLMPTHFRAGGGASGSHEARHPELRSLLEWLSESVDFTRQVTFECGIGPEGVAVGGRKVLLSRMTCLPLTGGATASRLQLSVPVDLQAEIVGLLTKVKAKGRVNDVDLAKVAEQWEVVGAEMVSAVTGQQEPAIFLVHRSNGGGQGKSPARGVVVAQWPGVDFAKVSEMLAAANTFNPAQHFAKLAEQPPPQALASAAGEQQQQQLLPQTSPPQRHEDVHEARQQPQLPRETTTSDVLTGGSGDTPPKVSTGDRVVIEFQGKWFRGVLQHVDLAGNVANVICDVDHPGVVTVVPLGNVWPAGQLPGSLHPCGGMRPEETQKQVFRHRRTRTVG